MSLKGKRIAILAENLYQEMELWVPYYRMKEEGAEVRVVGGLLRLEESAGKISRIINYGYCGDTIAYVAAQLGFEPATMGYHQSGPTLDGMIANAQLPWDAAKAPS